MNGCNRALQALRDYHDPRQRELYMARQRGIADGAMELHKMGLITMEEYLSNMPRVKDMEGGE